MLLRLLAVLLLLLPGINTDNPISTESSCSCSAAKQASKQARRHVTSQSVTQLVS
jgi:hypothetical protein